MKSLARFLLSPVLLGLPAAGVAGAEPSELRVANRKIISFFPVAHSQPGS